MFRASYYSIVLFCTFEPTITLIEYFSVNFTAKFHLASPDSFLNNDRHQQQHSLLHHQILPKLPTTTLVGVIVHGLRRPRPLQKPFGCHRPSCTPPTHAAVTLDILSVTWTRAEYTTRLTSSSTAFDICARCKSHHCTTSCTRPTHAAVTLYIRRHSQFDLSKSVCSVIPPTSHISTLITARRMHQFAP